MAVLSVTEYDGLALDNAMRDSGQGLSSMPAAQEPAATRQTLTYTSATATSVFSDETYLVRLAATSDLYYEIGTTPNTASAGSTLLPAGTVEYIGVTPGDKLSAYDGST